MLNPSIYIRIDEPISTLTDVLVSIICFYAWFQLRKNAGQNISVDLFAWFFMLMGIATFIGGVIGHAFLYALSFPWKLPGWLISMMSINILERAVIKYSDPQLKPAFSKFFSKFNVLELLIFAGLAFGTLNFQFVEVHSAYGIMVIVFGFALFNFFRGNRGAVVMNLVGGVMSALVAAVIFTLRVSVSEWFNYVDISHVFMAITALFFYRAASAILKEKA